MDIHLVANDRQPLRLTYATLFPLYPATLAKYGTFRSHFRSHSAQMETKQEYR